MRHQIHQIGLKYIDKLGNSTKRAVTIERCAVIGKFILPKAAPTFEGQNIARRQYHENNSKVQYR